MKKVTILLTLIFIMMACSSEDEEKEKEPIDNDIELIFNEPLLSMFGKTLADVKKAEKRTLIEQSESTLVYEEKKGELNYQIQYVTKDNTIFPMNIIFSYDYEFIKTINNELKKKYEYIGADAFLYTRLGKRSSIVISTQGKNTITVSYF